MRHPKVGRLDFKPNVTISDRINWRYRYIDGIAPAQNVNQLNHVLTTPAKELSEEEKRDWLRRVQGTVFVSDGFIPFRDNIDELILHGVSCVVAPRGSIRDREVLEACKERGIALIYTKRRFFHH